MTLIRSPPTRDRTAAPATAPDLLMVAPERVLQIQVGFIALLLALYIATKAFHVLGGHDYLLGFGPMLDLDRPANLPTFYAILVMLADAALLAAVGALYGAGRRPHAWQWLFLAVLLLLLAFDKAFNVHGQVGWAIHETVGNRRTAYLTFALLGLALAAAVAAVSIGLLIRVDRRTRWLLLASGALFVAGALGFEVLQILRHEVVRSTVERPDPVYLVLVAAEETLEMLGMALFNYTLLDHLRARFGLLTIRLD